MNDTGRVVATTAIWAALTVILVFGVFSTPWHGAVGVVGAVGVCLGLAAAASSGTKAVWSSAASPAATVNDGGSTSAD